MFFNMMPEDWKNTFIQGNLQMVSMSLLQMSIYLIGLGSLEGRALTPITRPTIIQRVTDRGITKAVIEATVMTMIFGPVIYQVEVDKAIEVEAVVVVVIETVMAVETTTTIIDSTTLILALFMADTNGDNPF